MFQREASALGDEVGELHCIVDDLVGPFQGERFCKFLNSQREHVDKRELPLRLVPAHIYTPRSYTVPNVLSRLVDSKILNSKVTFQRRRGYLLHEGRLAATNRACYSNGRRSGKPAS